MECFFTWAPAERVLDWLSWRLPCRLGKGCKTNYERVKGQAYKRDIVEFGEIIYFMAGEIDFDLILSVRRDEIIEND